MKTKILISLAFGIFAISIACNASATILSLTPEDMTGLRSFNHGASVSLLGFDAVKSGTEDRTIGHYDMNGLLDTFLSATLDIPIFNLDPGGTPGTFEVYSFNGDGVVSRDEWSFGTLIHTFKGIDDPQLILSLDVTSNVLNAITGEFNFLSFNFRAGTGSDRYWLSDNCGLFAPTLNIDYAPAPGSAPVPAPVPEPATLLLLGSGLAGLGVSRIKKRKK